MFSSTYLAERIAKLKEQVELYDTAINSLIAGSVESYTLDTGQTRQTVTKYDVVRLQRVVESLLNQIATLETRMNGSGVITVRQYP